VTGGERCRRGHGVLVERPVLTVDEQPVCREQRQCLRDRGRGRRSQCCFDVLDRPGPVEERKQAWQERLGRTPVEGDDRPAVLDEDASTVLGEPTPRRERRSLRHPAGRCGARAHQQSVVQVQQRITELQTPLEHELSSTTAYTAPP
jgi:hypothetical protein